MSVSTNAPTALSTDRVVLGIAMMLGFCACAPLLDVAAKLAADKIPVAQITTARFAVQSVIMFPVALLLGFSFRVPRALMVPLIARAVFLIASTYCFVAAIAVMPIADALAIVFVEPFILLLLGRFFFSEPVGSRRLTASLVGFCGVILVIQPSFSAFGAVAFFPLATALTFALYMLVTRSLSQNLHPIPLQFHTALTGTILCLPFLIWGFSTESPLFAPVMPVGIYWLWLFAVGAFASISHLLISYALKFAPSTTLAPLHYLEIVSALFFGYLIFNDIPNQTAIIGTSIIIGSGLYVFYRERKLEKLKQL